jgi:pyrimidine nucleoside transport protein
MENSGFDQGVDLGANHFHPGLNGVGKLSLTGPGDTKWNPEKPPAELQMIENNPDDDEYEDLEDTSTNNIFTRAVVKVRSGLTNLIVSHKKVVKSLVILTLFALYNAYLVIAVNYTVTDEVKVDWCDGIGFLFVLTGIVYWSFFYYFVLKGVLGHHFKRGFKALSKALSPIFSQWYVKVGITLLVLAGLGVFLYFDTEGQPRRLVSAGGILVLLLVGLLISKHPGRVNWQQVIWGIGLQFIFALLILRWQGGRDAFQCLSGKVSSFLNFSDVGSYFIYGFAAEGFNATVGGVEINLNPIFVFKNLSVIYFFSFCINLLYYYGAMQWVVSKVGWVLQITVGTTAAESMNAAANIFIGQTEAPILIKPFLAKMTHSELCAVMTGGFATIAGGVMAAYISFGVDAANLLSASVMAAPAALAYSKLIYPETKVSKTTSKDIAAGSIKPEGNALDAAAQGAVQGVILIANIAANVIAFMAFIAFLNAVIGWFGVLVGIDYLSFEYILGKVFIPVALVIGIDPEEAENVALLLGLKTVVNEFVAYQRLLEFQRDGLLSPRSIAIATYGLCSFSNVSSIGIQLGGLGAMCPERRADLTKAIGYAFIAGSIAGLLNACTAGMLLSEPGYPALPSGVNRFI